MRTIKFTKDNLFKIESFTGGKVTFFHNLSTASCKLEIPSLEDEKILKTIELVEGDVIHKDNKGGVFKQLN
jgi:hypothetical protein